MMEINLDNENEILTDSSDSEFETDTDSGLFAKIPNVYNSAPPKIPPKPENYTRFVFISDTHSLQLNSSQVPYGDVLVHSGDFTSIGTKENIQQFVNWFTRLPHRYKVMIAGNHDLTLDTDFYSQETNRQRFHRYVKYNHIECKSLLTSNPGITYLQDSATLIPSSYHSPWKIYGAPWQPTFGDWAFNVERGKDIREKWELIPGDTDILVTHGPPYGILDQVFHGRREHVGCEELVKKVEEVKPFVHAFGHIHEDYGVVKRDKTIFVNASTMGMRYGMINPPIVIDLTK